MTVFRADNRTAAGIRDPVKRDRCFFRRVEKRHAEADGTRVIVNRLHLDAHARRVIHAGGTDHLSRRRNKTQPGRGRLLHQAAVTGKLLLRPFLFGEICFFDMRDIVLDLNDGLDVFKRHGQVVDPDDILRVVIPCQQLAQLVESYIPPVQLDGPAFEQVPVFVQ